MRQSAQHSLEEARWSAREKGRKAGREGGKEGEGEGGKGGKGNKRKEIHFHRSCKISSECAQTSPFQRPISTDKELLPMTSAGETQASGG